MGSRYEEAQRQTLAYGLRSARLDGGFMSSNSSLATGGWEGGRAGGWDGEKLLRLRAALAPARGLTC